MGSPSSEPSASAPSGAPRSDQPRIRLPWSRPTSRTRTVPMRHTPSASTVKPGRRPRLRRVGHRDLVDRHCHGPGPYRLARAWSVVDVVVVGAGPNGLAAAITCAEAGRSVLVLEATEHIGGGTRTAELTLPGFRHDVCSAIHPLAAVSPFFAGAGLERHGLELAAPGGRARPPARRRPRRRAAPLDRARRSPAWAVDGTRVGPPRRLGRRALGQARRRRPSARSLRVPRHPFTHGGRSGCAGVLPATRRRSGRSRRDEAKGLFAGNAAHSFLPLDAARSPRPWASCCWRRPTSPGGRRAAGGSQAIADAMAARLAELGGHDRGRAAGAHRWPTCPTRGPCCSTSRRASSLDDLRRRAARRATARRLGRFRYGPARVQGRLRAVRAGAVDERRLPAGRDRSTSAARSRRSPRGEAEVAAGRAPDRPFVLVGPAEPRSTRHGPRPASTRSGPTATCPNGSDVDMTDAIERQLERFAPGFRDVVLARHVRRAGLVRGPQREPRRRRHRGRLDAGLQLACLRPRPGRAALPDAGPAGFCVLAVHAPGGGVHGMCGQRRQRGPAPPSAEPTRPAP